MLKQTLPSKVVLAKAYYNVNSHSDIRRKISKNIKPIWKIHIDANLKREKWLTNTTGPLVIVVNSNKHQTSTEYASYLIPLQC